MPLHDIPVRLKERTTSPPAPYGPAVLGASSSARLGQTHVVVITATVEAVFAYSLIS
ncbi:hypothetical protein UM396_07400 [Geobacillus subterraneus]|uniref:hypothetical protein n=1 Tax=Geobacillus subterraneus TaxID=129338 RepID=UPI002AC97B5E|nr:hypothetical protein [Geobacillus subterraneus]WPZ19717.1 hypothetical protein UM396_07400 [Geobacillus subterraneus]